MKMSKIWKNGILGVTGLLFMMAAFFYLPQTVQAATDNLAKYSNYKIYNVTDYGVDPTGTVKADAALKTMYKQMVRDINAGNLDGKSMAAVYFPSGTYALSQVFKLKVPAAVVAEADSYVSGTGVTLLQLEGAGSSLEGGVWNNSNKSSTTIYLNYAKNATVKNIRILSGGYGIKMRGENCTIDNIYVTNTVNTGIALTMGAKVTINNADVQRNGTGYPKVGFGHGIGVWSNAVLTLNDSVVNYNYQCGVSMNVGNVIINRTKLQYNKRNGVGTRGLCNVTMTDCDIYRNGFTDKMNGVIVVNGSKGSFTNCTFRNNSVTALLATDSGTSITVKNCTFKNNGYHNIYADNTKSGKITVRLDSNTYYNPKKSDSVRVHANKKSNYSLKITGTNIYNNVDPKYTYWVNNKLKYVN